MTHRVTFRASRHILLLAALLLLPLATKAYVESNGLYYEISSNRSATLIANPNGTKYSGRITIPIRFKKGNLEYLVTAIGDNAFCGCRSLKEITLPDSVEQLGTGVFWDCAELETARVGRGVKELPYNCFCRCGKLKSVTLSEGLEALGDCAFEYCSGLDEIIIPSGVTRFGGSVFSCCGELTLIAPAGSAAEKYAQKNGHGFRAAE